MKKFEHGDTIVEVMLALAVIGLVLGLSYATANRALRTGRFAQEQTEAVKLAEGQIERLKYNAGLTDLQRAANNIFDNRAGYMIFCMSDTFKKVLPTDPTFADDCLNRSGLYNQTVTYSPALDTFNVKVTWPTPANNQDGTVEIAYRLHP